MNCSTDLIADLVASSVLVGNGADTMVAAAAAFTGQTTFVRDPVYVEFRAQVGASQRRTPRLRAVARGTKRL